MPAESRPIPFAILPRGELRAFPLLAFPTIRDSAICGLHDGKRGLLIYHQVPLLTEAAITTLQWHLESSACSGLEWTLLREATSFDGWQDQKKIDYAIAYLTKLLG